MAAPWEQRRLNRIAQLQQLRRDAYQRHESAKAALDAIEARGNATKSEINNAARLERKTGDEIWRIDFKLQTARGNLAVMRAERARAAENPPPPKEKPSHKHKYETTNTYFDFIEGKLPPGPVEQPVYTGEIAKLVSRASGRGNTDIARARYAKFADRKCVHCDKKITRRLHMAPDVYVEWFERQLRGEEVTPEQAEAFLAAGEPLPEMPAAPPPEKPVVKRRRRKSKARAAPRARPPAVQPPPEFVLTADDQIKRYDIALQDGDVGAPPAKPVAPPPAKPAVRQRKPKAKAPPALGAADMGKPPPEFVLTKDGNIKRYDIALQDGDVKPRGEVKAKDAGLTPPPKAAPPEFKEPPPPPSSPTLFDMDALTPPAPPEKKPRRRARRARRERPMGMSGGAF